ncbi:hypothetical protein V5F49_14095 [Xanthobacter sp. V3C-3]|uniref:hypothetical protein n=1 Tax=Xanthobacter lutulentifluminis TaxID=3119935 RepID=UPI003729A67A
MSVQMILLPLFVHVALMLALMVRDSRAEPARPGTEAVPALLFYTLTALAFFTRKADVAFVVLAWIFVVLSLILALPGLRGARIGERTAGLVRLAVLALMWGLFALAILLNI